MCLKPRSALCQRGQPLWLLSVATGTEQPSYGNRKMAWIKQVVLGWSSLARGEEHLPQTHSSSQTSPDHCLFSLNSGWFLTLNYLVGFPGVPRGVSMEFSSLQWDKNVCDLVLTCQQTLEENNRSLHRKTFHLFYKGVKISGTKKKLYWSILKTQPAIFFLIMKNILPKKLFQKTSCIQQARGRKPALRQHFRQHLIKSQSFECCLPHHIVFPGVI